jgi:hypothetical protein
LRATNWPPAVACGSVRASPRGAAAPPGGAAHTGSVTTRIVFDLRPVQTWIRNPAHDSHNGPLCPPGYCRGFVNWVTLKWLPSGPCLAESARMSRACRPPERGLHQRLPAAALGARLPRPLSLPLCHFRMNRDHAWRPPGARPGCVWARQTRPTPHTLPTHTSGTTAAPPHAPSWERIAAKRVRARGIRTRRYVVIGS